MFSWSLISLLLGSSQNLATPFTVMARTASVISVFGGRQEGREVVGSNNDIHIYVQISMVQTTFEAFLSNTFVHIIISLGDSMRIHNNKIPGRYYSDLTLILNIDLALSHPCTHDCNYYLMNSNIEEFWVHRNLHSHYNDVQLVYYNHYYTCLQRAYWLASSIGTAPGEVLPSSTQTTSGYIKRT